MKKEFLKINGIPAILWGEKSENLIIAVHGNSSYKEDTPITILAEIAVGKIIRYLVLICRNTEREKMKKLCAKFRNV